MTDTRSSPGSGGLSFQNRVVNWLMECFSMDICRDGVERNHRFLEEALELVQSLDCTRSEAHQLVDYVFDRPAGEPAQELGGSLVTLTALANCHDMDMMEAGETELARVWTKIDKIRAKQAAKPKHGPLPQHVGVAQASSVSLPASLAQTLRDHLQQEDSFVWLDEIEMMEAALSASPPSPVAGEACDALAILNLYFAPWEAAKAARWEDLTNDASFNPEEVLRLVHGKLKASSLPSTDDGSAA